MEQTRKRILVGMSGGVDSSVSAALLVAQGYEVLGGYMRNWSDSKDASGVCTWKSDRRDAQRVAAQLGIPLQTFDFEEQYRTDVLEYLYAEYECGRTPNPDVLCNQYIKFGYFLTAADALGCDGVATGHYAGNHVDPEGTAHLLRAKDEGKDQTYFLHQLTQSQLRRAIFPLANYTKKEVRSLALEMHLSTAEKKESMGICFVGKVPMKDFLRKKLPEKPGDVVHENGVILGRHDGLSFYTIGQRHGFAQSGGGEALYVAQKDFEHTKLIVAPHSSSLLLSKNIILEKVHWIAGKEPHYPLLCLARLRHRQDFVACIVSKDETNRIVVTFVEKQWGVTQGQFCVFYTATECLGGGAIDNAFA